VVSLWYPDDLDDLDGILHITSRASHTASRTASFDGFLLSFNSKLSPKEAFFFKCQPCRFVVIVRKFVVIVSIVSSEWETAQIRPFLPLPKRSFCLQKQSISWLKTGRKNRKTSIGAASISSHQLLHDHA
jgi:hypothetical protein